MTEFDKVIPPGGVGKITASMATTHYKGRIAKGLTVTTNDPAQRTFALQLAADVVPALSFLPGDRPTMQGKVGDVKPVALRVESTDGQPFDVVRVDADPKLEVRIKPMPGNGTARARSEASRENAQEAAPPVVAAGSKRYAIRVAVKPDTPIGRSLPRVALTTSHPRAQVVAFHVNLALLGALQVVPERVLLRPAQATAQHVKIRKLEGDGLAIAGVESSDADFTTAIAPVVEGREYDLTVQYVGKPGRGPVNARITITTNEPAQRAIVIPILGRL